jgi:N-acyl-D-amino-acid deacylase
MRSRFRLLLLGLGLLGGAGLPPPGLARAPATTLLQGGDVLDGTGNAAQRLDVRIAGDTISEVGQLERRPGERVLDARELVIAPGFIDTHSHADDGLLEPLDAELHLRQGITTAVVGQDGSSAPSLEAFFSALQATPPALNIASFAGHGTLRRRVMGDDYRRPATAAELDRMGALLRREMAAGALGLSSGLEYAPGKFATTEELIACARVAGESGGLYASHLRNEDNEVFAAIDEAIRIAREARLPVQISHVKLGSTRVWGRAEEVLQRIRDANQAGLDVSADVYPYRYWQSYATVLNAAPGQEGPAGWERGLADVGGAANVMVSDYAVQPEWNGMTLSEIAGKTGKDPVTLLQEIARRSVDGSGAGGALVTVTAMAEEDLRRFLASPLVMFCTDGGARFAHPHPRGAGTYPRLLGRYVRETGVLSLPEAVRKMTSLPARRLGFADRGLIRPGMKADLVVFDPHCVRDTATPDYPRTPPLGIDYVLVNGAIVLDGGQLTGRHPGLALRRTRARSTSRSVLQVPPGTQPLLRW